MDPQEPETAPDDEVTVGTGTGARIGMLELIAGVVVGITAFTVGSVVRRLGGIDEVAG